MSIVIPVYNEEEVIPFLRAEMQSFMTKLDVPVEILVVDDGSTDCSWAVLTDWAAQDKRIKLLRLARNFGHQLAITVGLDYVEGDAVVVMDADLQDPPEIIIQMLAEYRRGYEIVYGRRTERDAESFLKKATAWAFYRVMKYLVYEDLPPDVGDFRLISKACLDALRKMREHHRFMRGMVAWVGFAHTVVNYRRAPRVAGRTKYPLTKMIAFAWSAATSFSTLPLKMCFLLGAAMTLAGILYGLYAISCWLAGSHLVQGWTSLIVLICLIGGSLQIGLGIVGDYVAKIFEEVKGRPLYILSSTVNIRSVEVSSPLFLAQGQSA